jgi:hypothetical protein
MEELNHRIKKEEARALSDREVKAICGGRCTVVPYPDVYKYKSIDQLLGPHGAVAILYEVKKDNGHWIALYRKNSTTLSLFDSYGIKPDRELNFVPKHFAALSHQNAPYLSRLMREGPYPHIEFNERPLQKFRPGINTCGRFVGLRIALRHWPLDKFRALFHDKTLSPDFIATFLTT